jgi:hypothetical protein
VLFVRVIRGVWKLSGGVKVLIRLSLALLLSLLVSAPSHALLARRVIEHRVMSNTASTISCKADAARLCPGVADNWLPECLMRHKNLLSLGCAKEMNKLERKMGE